MVGGKLRLRVSGVLLLCAGSWFACSSGEHRLTEEGSGAIASTQQALAPGWTPGLLNPSAWYVASAADVHTSSGAVSVWSEHRSNGRDLTGYGQPQFNPAGWDGHQPTVTFDGNNRFGLDGWSDAPAGTDAAFTVLAVIRSASSSPQTASIASWWSSYAGLTWVGVKAQDNRTLLDMGRTYGIAEGQTHSSPHDLGTGSEVAASHAVAYRYSPGPRRWRSRSTARPRRARRRSPSAPCPRCPSSLARAPRFRPGPSKETSPSSSSFRRASPTRMSKISWSTRGSNGMGFLLRRVPTLALMRAANRRHRRRAVTTTIQEPMAIIAHRASASARCLLQAVRQTSRRPHGTMRVRLRFPCARAASKLGSTARRITWI